MVISRQEGVVHAKVGDFYLVVGTAPRNGMISMLRSSRCARRRLAASPWCVVGW